MGDNTVILHIPHSSTYIPPEYRKDILLSDEELEREIYMMADLYVQNLFDKGKSIISPISRLICDMERFKEDENEPMSKLGMGVVYTKTSTGKLLRNLSEYKRESIINKWYDPHHNALIYAVEEKLKEHDKCFIIDCHSFDKNMSYTGVEAKDMPDFCIGTDDFHTPPEIIDKIRKYLITKGYSVEINKPFSGTLVPLYYYKKDNRVKSIMIEINKKLYIKEKSDLSDNFQNIKRVCDAITKIIGGFNA